MGGSLTLRKLLGVIVIAVILGMTVSAALFDSIMISNARLRILILLAGALLGLDATREVVVEYTSQNRDFSLDLGEDE